MNRTSLESAKMAMNLEIQREYGYVIFVLISCVILNFWMALQVGKARKKYKVFYPKMYAEESENKDAKLFNCVQRGHQNSLEFMPVFFTLLLLGGLKYPILASIFGALYVVGRFFYFTGYATGEPINRMKGGKVNFPALIGLLACTVSFGISLISH